MSDTPSTARNAHQQIVSTALYVDTARCEGLDQLVSHIFGEQLLPNRVPVSKLHFVLVPGTRDVLSAEERKRIGRSFEVEVYGYTKPNSPVQALIVRCPNCLVRSPGLSAIIVATRRGHPKTARPVIHPCMVKKLPKEQCVTIRMRMGAMCRVVTSNGGSRYRCRFRHVH